MDLLSGYSDNALSGFNGYTPQANAAYNNSMSGQNANLAYVGGQDQSVLNQIYYDMMTKGPASGYGTVGGYPSFGEARNYGGQNDPFSGGYAPGNQGYSGVPVQTQAPANNPYDPYADRMDAAPQYDMDAYRRALAETMAAYQQPQQQPQQPQSYLPDYTGSAFPGFYGRDQYQDPNPFGGGAQVNFPTLQNNDPYSALSTWRQPGGDSGTAAWGGQPMDSGGGGLKYLPGGGLDTSDAGNIAFYNRMMNGGQQGVTDPMGYGNPYEPQIGAPQAQQPQPETQSWGDWFKQYQQPAGPQPGEGSMNPSADWLRNYLNPNPTNDPNSLTPSFGPQSQTLPDYQNMNPFQMQGGLKYGSNGQLDQSDPGNIAFYNKMMGGGGGQIGGGFNPYAGLTGTEGSNNVPKDSNYDPLAAGRNAGYDVMRQMQQQQAPFDTRGSQGWGIGGIENYLKNPGQGPTNLNPSAPAQDPYGNPLWNGGGAVPYLPGPQSNFLDPSMQSYSA
jgi:hypothetical protein